jgi:arylsulfatase A-like enzyme
MWIDEVSPRRRQPGGSRWASAVAALALAVASGGASTLAVSPTALRAPATAAPATAAPASGAGRPNVVVIVADDLGYGDIGVYGGDIPTPRIDSIARDGVRFTAGYVTAPVCNPSRAGLMSGRYQERWGQEMNEQELPPDGAPRLSLPLTERTLGAAFKARGYATGAIGKWHLGMQPRYHPMDRGFDEFFGMGSGTLYVDRRWPGVHVFENLVRFDNAEPPVDGESEDAERLARRGLFDGREPARLEEYVTDQLAGKAVDFIDRHRGDPFFLYIAFNAPHAPLQTTDRYYQRFPRLTDERKRIHAAMISALDDGVGRVLDEIEEIGGARDTIVVFVSDNGGPVITDVDGRCNAPFVGHKRDLYEGGIRLPFLMRWSQRLAAGVTYEEMVSTLDLFPTLLAAAGEPLTSAGSGGEGAEASLPALDGVDLLPFLTDRRKGSPHGALFWRSGPNGAMRDGRYKLLLAGELVRLYDLDRDPTESRDLSARKRGLVSRMRAAWNAWSDQLSEPRTSRRTAVSRVNGDEIRWHI